MREIEWLTSEDPGPMLHQLLHWTCDYRPSDRKLRLWVEACRAVVGDLMESVWVDMDEPGMALHSAEVWATMCPGYVKALPYPARAALLREIVGNPWGPVGLWDDLGRKAMEWLTPTVISIARAAYDSRDFSGLPVLADALEEAGCPAEVPGKDRCTTCKGRGDYVIFRGPGATNPAHKECSTCSGTGEVAVKDPHPLLGHLRGPGPHVRGCWALDLVLGLG